VGLEAWCGWTGNPWGKVKSIVGRSFRMPGPHESIYTMAANAVLQLVLDYDVDPARVGHLALGTESATDNSAGAVIVKGMVDRALRALGRPSLSRNCEVPEVKHACLGGIYALKGALRYLAHDGRGRQAIVVCGDIAEYERGSTGEQTQGAGTVAMLVEEHPLLLEVDLHHAGSAADYRGPDFRKPFRRYATAPADPLTGKMHDFPTFSGRYSTVCYIDETLRAVEDMLARMRVTPRSFFHQIEGVLLHRPYHQMPVNAMAALYAWGLSKNEAHLGELKQLCDAAGASYDKVLVEMRSHPSLFDAIEAGSPDGEVYPESMKAVKHFRTTEKFKEVVTGKMSLGSGRMMDLGNLYTASLPAWLAAAFEEALERKVAIEEKQFLLIGYGSGDAAEAIPVRVSSRWRDAAEKMGLHASLARAVDLNREQYESLHDGRKVDLGYQPAGEFVIDHVGTRHEAEFQDAGIEYYRYVP
jgi:hydroxymethylglutaryl-CoA synthase